MTTKRILTICKRDADTMHEQMMTEKSVAETNTRYDRKQALDLLTDLPMGELMRLAHQERMRRFPDSRVSFVVDTNPNYTNVCVTRCRFCAFCRKAGDNDAYLLTPGQLAESVRMAADKGATTVLLQGGHNPVVDIGLWLAYIRAIRDACPGMHVHPFSPAEIAFMADKEKISVAEVLRMLWEAGIRTIPGGGAEILTERVRRIIAPHKAGVDAWLGVCETAHGIGFKTTATMMFGHVESDAEIIDHLLRLRDLQDSTAGFTSFIPWSFKPGQTDLAREVKQPAHPARYVRIIAVARLVLDNFTHIQSSWFSENIAAGQLGLLAGADDFGGVLVEEHVHREAGHDRRATVDNVVTIIRRAGFTPARRDSNYQVRDIYPAPLPVGTGGAAQA
ncbi:cyclic dehypoxanthine futalosine synthase [Desulfosarcina ovata subsp. sediminis]|uniref:Cyclic dehypoxanthine futalosine synthase n=1 Tax=Desulfosarcina ovata subsp. sediminis TaxID=885957 RepID=A0A5K7ZHZ4_9BACT|nr:cyclic dehypoxanthinyl futalosine synthase [Desulfosarcina ovata]BBO79567.1 cyclic dehypoxanthine futalosine synthase [Desulfosarcina ovata subsp. sediminis]